MLACMSYSPCIKSIYSVYSIFCGSVMFYLTYISDISNG